MLRALHLLAALVGLSLPFTSLATADTVRYLSPLDSVRVDHDPMAGIYLHHTMTPGQTLYSLARFYGLNTDQLLAFNPELQAGYRVGSVVKIPIPLGAIVRHRAAGFRLGTMAPVYYRIKRGETLFGLTHRTFTMHIDTLRQRNHMGPESALRPDQLVLVGWLSVQGINPDTRGEAMGPDYALQLQFMRESGGRIIRQHNGAAAQFRETGSRNTRHFYALHRFAPVGSVVEVYNPQTRLKLYLKVVDRIPDSLYGDEVVVVVSAEVAHRLRGLDNRFYVKVRYIE